MSMNTYREDCNRAKSARAGIVEQRPVSARAKKATSIILESRPISEAKRIARLLGGKTEWRKWSSYRSIREAEQARDNLMRKHSSLWEFRIKPDSE